MKPFVARSEIIDELFVNYRCVHCVVRLYTRDTTTTVAALIGGFIVWYGIAHFTIANTTRQFC